MKKLFLTTLLLAFVISNLLAQTYTVGNLVYTFNNEGVTLYSHVNGSSASGEIIIPESVSINGNNYAVTAIADLAFYDCYSLNGALIIPNTVKTIGDYSFHDCQFTSLTLSNTLLSIGNGAFSNCHLLNGTLTIPESVTYIGEYAFAGCSGFTGNLSIPNSITTINDYTFIGCYGFTSLTLPEFLTSIGEGAFKDCQGFTNTLTLPSSLTNIGEYAFSWCLGFTGDLIIPESITYISAYAFDNCQGFTGKLSLPSTLTYIGDNGFMGCVFFTKVITLATTPPDLGVYAFEGLIISTLTVPSGCIPIYQSSDWHLYFETFNNDWSGTHADSYAGGDGSEENPYQIATAEQLALLAYETNNETGGDAHYILTNDICLGGGDFWEPIGKLIAMDDDYPCFTGVFNGNGHTISEMLVSDCYYSGLFGRTRGATIENVNIQRSTIVGGYQSGLIAGYIKNTDINNCIVQGSIMESPQMAGGIVGYCRNEESETSNIINCIHNIATIFGGTYTGGIVGASEGNGTLRIEGCINYGEIIGHIMAGGILGNGSADINNCSNHCIIYPENDSDYLVAGGIAGQAGNSKITNCYNFEPINGGHVGGICGNATMTEIVCCGNQGDVHGYTYDNELTLVGGISGSGGAISDCFNRGSLIINNCANANPLAVHMGGIIGTFSSDGYIHNCYNISTINHYQYSNGQYGIIAGAAPNSDYFNNCYWSGNYDIPACSTVSTLPGSCSFSGTASQGNWYLTEAQYNTHDLLQALNRGAVHGCYWILYDVYPKPIYLEPSYPVVGTEWYYEIINFNGSITYQYLECAADTIIGNTRPKVIIRSNTLYDKDLYTKVTHEYVYSEDGIVYWWDKQSQSYTTLYDFNANVGDQWTIHVGTQSIMIHVDDVENVEYNGATYRVLSVRDANDIFTGDIICGIGHTTSFFPEKMLNNRDFNVDGIRCYWHFGEELLQFGEVDCDEIYNIYNDVAENEVSEIEVYPNPAKDILIIKSDVLEMCHGASLQEYTITNITGQIMMRGTISSDNQQVDVSNLENGMYFIKVGEKSVRFIKN